MATLNDSLEVTVKRRGAVVRLVTDTVEHSIENARRTMQFYLVRDSNKALAQQLLSEMADTTKTITELNTKIEAALELHREKELFLNVKEKRLPYVTSRKRS